MIGSLAPVSKFRVPRLGRVAVRWLAVLVVVGLVATSCRVELDGVGESTSRSRAFDVTTDPPTALPVLGPIPNASHWHAAYVVRVCDEVLEPFEAQSDEVGIHTHGNGLIHIHPWVEEAAFGEAKLSRFADAVDLTIADGELTLPTGGTWRDGDLCNGVPGRVFVDRWEGPLSDTPVERIFDGLADLQFSGDAELYQIAFAPEDSPPVVPPAEPLLNEVSNLGPAPEPWIVVPETVTTSSEIWEVESIERGPCAPELSPELVPEGVAQRCFGLAGAAYPTSDVVISARAVQLNRRPALELVVDPVLLAATADHFLTSPSPFVFALRLDGQVVAVASLFQQPVTNRIIISSGFSEAAAVELADRINGFG